MKLAEQILGLFRGRQDFLAVGAGDAFRPEELKKEIPPAWFAKQHLAGTTCLGFYLLTTAGQCFCSCVDFDNKAATPDPLWQEKAEAVYFELVQLGFTPLIEVSQSGMAAHVWLFFDGPTDAWLVRKFWDAVSASSGVTFVEVYPRQDDLAGKKLGNLIRYPLFGQSRFVDVERDWETIDPAEAMDSVRKTDALALSTIIFQLTGVTPRKPETGVSEGGLPRRVERLVSNEHTLLGKRWRGDMAGMKDPSRSALCQSIVCELVRQYVPTPEVEQALSVWCATNGYEKGEREDWIGSTVSKAYDFVATRDAERTATSWTLVDAVHELIDGLDSEPPTIATGLQELDRSIDGIGAGEMCVVAARPSHGKSAFGLQWLENAAGHGVPCLFISEEMSRRELAKRALLRVTDVEEEDWKAKKKKLHGEVDSYHLGRAPIYGVESCQSIDVAEKVIDQHCQIHGVRLVAVDYLQLLDGKGTSRYENVTDISKRLKQAALRNKCSVVALCQLNREIEKRPGRIPQMSDMRESGQIEQDADLILSLEWPFRIDPKAEPDTYNVWCLKRRNGPIRSNLVTTIFNPDRQRFGNYHANYDVQELPPHPLYS